MIAPIPGHPGYYATSDGRIVSFWRTRLVSGFRGGARSSVVDDGRELAAFDRMRRDGKPSGYRSVCLVINGKRRNRYVHHLVLEAFVGPRPTPEAEACHKNDVGADNRLDNLYWGTKAQNTADRHATGAFARAWTNRLGGDVEELEGAFDGMGLEP